jgi:hypothetical protein
LPFFSGRRGGDPHQACKKGSRAMILLLILASGLIGIVLARFFRVYVVIPAMLFIIVPAYFLGQYHGLSAGLIAFAASAVAMQVCYFVGMVGFVLIDNFWIEKAPSESSIFLSLQN